MSSCRTNLSCRLTVCCHAAAYTEVGEDEDLPMGPEYQTLVNCFIDRSAADSRHRYRHAARLLKQLE